MVKYLSRDSWGARDPKPGPGPMDPDEVLGVVVHWPGTTSHDPIHSLAAVASALRGWQAYHMDSRGWSDIAYQVAVDQEGRAWLLRGFGTKSGANGNAALNDWYGAVLLVLVQGEEPSAAMKATTREVIADFRRRFRGANAIRPHSAVRPDGTDCPGPRATAALKRGEFTPGHDVPQEDELSAAEVSEIKKTIQDYAEAVNTFARQTVAAYSKAQTEAIVAAINTGDDKVIAKIIDAIEADETERSRAILSAVPDYIPPAADVA